MININRNNINILMQILVDSFLSYLNHIKLIKQKITIFNFELF